jgi:hypothetical protein
MVLKRRTCMSLTWSGGSPETPQRHSNTVVAVDEIPQCCLCEDGTLAEFDAKLVELYGGQWGFVCARHFKRYGAYSTLGIGKAQRLVLR